MEARYIIALVLIVVVIVGLVITAHLARERAHPKPEPRLKRGKYKI
jgi:energy-converting hydrogenase Eha subunit F